MIAESIMNFIYSASTHSVPTFKENLGSFLHQSLKKKIALFAIVCFALFASYFLVKHIYLHYTAKKQIRPSSPIDGVDELAEVFFGQEQVELLSAQENIKLERRIHDLNHILMIDPEILSILNEKFSGSPFHEQVSDYSLTFEEIKKKEKTFFDDLQKENMKDIATQEFIDSISKASTILTQLSKNSETKPQPGKGKTGLPLLNLKELALIGRIQHQLRTAQAIVSPLIGATIEIPINPKLIIESCFFTLENSRWTHQGESFSPPTQENQEKRLSATFSPGIDGKYKEYPGIESLSVSLTRLVNNILSNAGKYGSWNVFLEAKYEEPLERGTEKELRISKENTREMDAYSLKTSNPKLGYLIIKVRDSGAGIVRNIEGKTSRQIALEAWDILTTDEKQNPEDIRTGQEQGSANKGHGGANMIDLLAACGGKIEILTRGMEYNGTQITVKVPCIRESCRTPTEKWRELSELIPKMKKKVEKAGMLIAIIDDQIIPLKSNAAKIFGAITPASGPTKRGAPVQKLSILIDKNPNIFKFTGTEPLSEMTQAIDQAITSHRTIAFIVDSELGPGGSGHDLVERLQQYCADRSLENPAYERSVFYFSCSATPTMSSRHLPLYNGGHFSKEFSKEDIIAGLFSILPPGAESRGTTPTDSPRDRPSSPEKFVSNLQPITEDLGLVV